MKETALITISALLTRCLPSPGTVLEPMLIGNWSVIPTDWVIKAKIVDIPLLYKSNLH